MHPDVLLLAERLVRAMETMSADVKNMSAYMYDLSRSVSLVLNERREREGGDNHPFGQEASDDMEYAWQFEQASRSSGSGHVENETSAADVPSTSFDGNENSNGLSSFVGHIKVEELPEAEEDDESYDMDNSISSGRNNMRRSSKEVNQISRVKCSPASSSSQSVLVDAKGMNTHEHFSRNTSSSDHGTVLLQNFQSPDSFAVASCSTGNDMMGLRQEEPVDQTKSEAASCEETDLEREMQKATSLRSSSTGSEREGRRRANQCFICKRQFLWKSLLIKHIRVHTNERPFKCNLCGKAFKQCGNLSEHMLTHSDERHYQCNQCGKCFKTNSKLREHKRTHTTERPFKCSWCEKGFLKSSDLTRHIRIHTGEKPFRCNQCGKEFRQKGELTGHERTHSREKRFICSICGKHFVSAGKLSRHSLLHLGTLPTR